MNKNMFLFLQPKIKAEKHVDAQENSISLHWLWRVIYQILRSETRTLNQIRNQFGGYGEDMEGYIIMGWPSIDNSFIHI